jgi:large subunit ribosomal protein L31
MKANTHPVWYNDTLVTCACGNTFTTGSTKKTITVDICSACHPFYTGEMRFIDTQGRVEKFQAKLQNAQTFKAVKKAKIARKKQNIRPESLHDMLMREKKKLDSAEASVKKA